jgi:hypothetical protein
MVSERSGPACRSESGAYAEHQRRGKRYKWQKCSRAGQYGSHSARYDWGHRRVDGVHKPKPAEDKMAGHDEANGPGD